MSKHWIEIEDFSEEEVTEMFNVICVKALGRTSPEVKKNFLGKKNARDTTLVNLVDLADLITKEGLEVTLRVAYLKPDEVKKEEIVEAPKLDIGLKIDPVNEAMKEQNEIVADVKRNFTEVGATKVNAPMSSDVPSENMESPKFDPGAIPDFKI